MRIRFALRLAWLFDWMSGAHLLSSESLSLVTLPYKDTQTRCRACVASAHSLRAESWYGASYPFPSTLSMARRPFATISSTHNQVQPVCWCMTYSSSSLELDVIFWDMVQDWKGNRKVVTVPQRLSIRLDEWTYVFKRGQEKLGIGTG